MIRMLQVRKLVRYRPDNRLVVEPFAETAPMIWTYENSNPLLIWIAQTESEGLILFVRLPKFLVLNLLKVEFKVLRHVDR